jgi:Holliday junction resolvase RusA-like endonuclease
LAQKSESHRSVFRQINLRKFRPLTASSSKKVARKMKLKELIEEKIGKDLKKIQRRCEGEHLLIDVVFHVIESDKKGRSKSDLDNLLKPLFDVLSINMVNGQKPISGVGLIKDDSQIYEIRCKKVSVKEDEPDNEGLDLQISIIPKNK